jgi:phosphoglycolate phosphatase
MDYQKVYIQTHNHPDADAIASAWGMKKLVEKLGKEAEIIFFGNHLFKPNIDNLVNQYRIKMTVIGEGFAIGPDELLIVVDGQYGTGNVCRVTAQNIIAVDHHLVELNGDELYRDIQPKIGACTTLIYGYLKEYDVPIDQSLATILYYGIFMDTDMFTGKMTTLDHEARRELEESYDKKTVDRLRLSSMSFDDLRIYANGILKTERYNDIIFSYIEECDDNLLGHISDLLSEINGIQIVVIYSPRNSGYKLSVRSYHEFITAEELVKELINGIGSGGGHLNKAGGFIALDRFEREYPHISIGPFIQTKIIDYCREIRLFVTGEDDPYAIYGRESFVKAQKKKIYLRYLDISDYFKEDVTIKTLEGVATANVHDKIIIGIKNEIWPVKNDLFERKYLKVEDKTTECFSEKFMDDYGMAIQSDNGMMRITKANIQEFNVCLTKDEAFVDAIKLRERIKVRTVWGEFTAKKGDYLLVNSIDDYYICDEAIFNETYTLL